MRKGKLDYLLDDKATISVWLELCLCNTNPMFEDYSRKEYEIIDHDHALKISQANRRDVALEWRGQEYTVDWNDNSLPPIPRGKARLWCIKAWKLTENHNRELRAAYAEDDRKRAIVAAYFTDYLGRTPEESKAAAHQLSPEAIDGLLQMAEQALAQRELAIQSSDAADASAIINGTLDVEIDPTIPIEETKAALEHAQGYDFQKKLHDA